ncbi:MAG: sialidase family protein [Armatimonadota bacterium]
MSTREFRPNAEPHLGATWHVAQQSPAASDEGPGTAERPFLTITAGAAAADMGDRVIIHEGVYREEVPLPRNGHRYRPHTIIRYEAAPGERVWLRGSDPFNADWDTLGDGTHRAPLPEALFADDAYNPWELSAVINETDPVRPCEGPHLPETRGALWVGGEPLRQLASIDAVRRTSDSFAVSPDGRLLIANFGGRGAPSGDVELAVRERCFRPLFDDEPMIETVGIQVEHAAEPGPLCYAAPLSIRQERPLTVRRIPVLRSTVRICRAIGEPAYVSTDSARMIVAREDSVGVIRAEDNEVCTITSDDAGRTWRRREMLGTRRQIGLADHFLDEQNGVLLRWYTRHTDFDPDGAHGRRDHEVILDTSRDGGASWSSEVIDHGTYYFRPLVHSTGTLVWPYTDHVGGAGHHHGRLRLRLGEWNGGRYAWSDGGVAEAGPDISSGGLAEPAAVELPDGRIFILLRAGDVRPQQNSPGVPSVKRWCVSDDAGKTLSRPKILRYEDGTYLYSPRSFPGVWRSRTTDRVFVIVNTARSSAVNCDPRTSVEIGELDPATLTVRRDSMATIERKHPEHHPLVRLSNWSQIEERESGDLLLFMQLHMSEFCPVRQGYDFRVFRYQITMED